MPSRASSQVRVANAIATLLAIPLKTSRDERRGHFSNLLGGYAPLLPGKPWSPLASKKNIYHVSNGYDGLKMI